MTAASGRMSLPFMREAKFSIEVLGSRNFDGYTQAKRGMGSRSCPSFKFGQVQGLMKAYPLLSLMPVAI